MSYKFDHLILAYGSNLNQHDWGKFCKRYGYPVDILQFEEMVKIPDYKLVFDWYSSSRKGGAANIKRAVGHYVEAVLFSTNDQGIKALRQKEGHPYAYLETEVIALKNDGSEVEAKTYIVPQSTQRKYERPTREYYDICKEGYEAYDLCTKNLVLAASGEEPTPLCSLFTYGTLMRGEERHELIVKGDYPRWNIDFALTASVRGKLSTNGRFPGLDQRSEDHTHGDYFCFSNISEVLAITDKIEGFSEFGSNSNFFRRTLTHVNTGGFEEELAWVYVYEKNLGCEIVSNDWRVHNRSKLHFYWALIETYGQYDPTFFGRLDERRTSPSGDTDKTYYGGLEQNLCLGRLSERDLASASGFYSAWPKESWFSCSEQKKNYEDKFFKQLDTTLPHFEFSDPSKDVFGTP